MKNTVLKGSLILIIAGIIGKVLGAVFRIPLSNILGAEGIGIYQMIFPVFSLALIISSGGVSVTIAHTIAQIRASGNGNQKKEFFKGFYYSLFTSLIFAIIFFVWGQSISNLQGNVLAGNGYKMVSVALVFSSLLAAFRGVFQGYQNMLPTAVSQIIEQAFKVLFGLVFSYFFVQESIELGVVGAFLGIGIAEILSFIYLLVKKKNFKFEEVPNQNHTSKFFLINLSITLGFLIIPLITTFDSFVVVNILKQYFSPSLATSLYGIQSGMVNSLINFPVVVSIAVSLAILPDLSFVLASKDIALAKEKIEKVFSMMFFIIVPCVLLFYFFSEEIMGVLYGNIDESMLKISSDLLKISSVQILFISFLQICITIFQSLDKPNIPIIILLISGLIKAVLTIILVKNPSFNIFGLAISNVVFYATASVSALILVKKKIPFSLSNKSLKFGGVALLGLGLCFYLISLLDINLLIKISLVCFTGLVVYCLPIYYFDILGVNHLIKKKLKR